MFFKDIVGQEQVKQQLRKMIDNNRFPHALMLHGNEGTGVFPLGLACARYLSCPNRTETDACGVCPSCLKFNKLAHPDLHFVFPMVKDAKRKKEVCNDYMDEWRAFLKENVYFSLNDWLNVINTANGQGTIYTGEGNEIIRKLSFKTFEAENKIMIIWLPEKMQTECANRLLKILEEPYPNTHFILLSEAPEYTLGTILSRCQMIAVPNIDTDSIQEKIQTDFHMDGQNASVIAQIANGSYLAALENIEMGETKAEMFNLFVGLMRMSYAKDIKGLKKWSDDVAALGREQQKMFLSYTQHLLRENFIANFRNPALNYMNTKEKEFSVRFSPFIHERNIQDLMDEMERSAKEIAYNVNSKMIFFDMALKITVFLKRK